ncbi:hypothetical protein ACIQOW_38205 [Kitasatospora sp. NPDC091335]|uniref:HD domain-containing protein n=1 Tax=Kitasatospora sp. NPDC091335 TaxID=3364085 RepID=UPI003807756C
MLVWQHVREDPNAERYQRVVLEAVGELARLRDSADMADDPWQDPGIVERFVKRVGWLLGNAQLGLYPAEAALLALLPFLYRVRSLRLAATRLTVGPTDLVPSPEPDADRSAYEQFVESRDLLVGRTRTRPASAASSPTTHSPPASPRRKPPPPSAPSQAGRASAWTNAECAAC